MDNSAVLCRLCDKNTNSYIDILTNLWLIDVIAKCLKIQIQLHDGSSTRICADCNNRLVDWNSFYSTITSKHHYQTEHPSCDKSDGCISTLPENNLENNIVIDISNSSKTHHCHASVKNHTPKKTLPKKTKNVRGDLLHKTVKNTFEICKYCDKVFTQRSSYKRHLRGHENYTSHNCGLCSKVFASKLALKQHLDSHEVCKKYCCDSCGVTFKRGPAMYNHMKSHHIGKVHQCPSCQKQFTKKNDLLIHMGTHSDSRPYRCPDCPSAFRAQGSLKRHRLSLHLQVSNHQCQECGERFRHAYMLRQHSDTHNGVKPFACDTCTKAFRTKNQLFRHTRSHNGEKPFKCDFCSQSFADTSNRKRHVLLHEKASKKHKYQEYKSEYEYSENGDSPKKEPSTLTNSSHIEVIQDLSSSKSICNIDNNSDVSIRNGDFSDYVFVIDKNITPIEETPDSEGINEREFKAYKIYFQNDEINSEEMKSDNQSNVDHSRAKSLLKMLHNQGTVMLCDDMDKKSSNVMDQVAHVLNSEPTSCDSDDNLICLQRKMSQHITIIKEDDVIKWKYMNDEADSGNSHTSQCGTSAELMTESTVILNNNVLDSANLQNEVDIVFNFQSNLTEVVPIFEESLLVWKENVPCKNINEVILKMPKSLSITRENHGSHTKSKLDENIPSLTIVKECEG